MNNLNNLCILAKMFLPFISNGIQLKDHLSLFHHQMDKIGVLVTN
jgi:hypothetical protein